MAGHPPTYEELDRQQLKYLDAVVLEALRLHTPVPKDSKMCISNCILPDGTKVPAGAMVVYVPYVIVFVMAWALRLSILIL
jgi:cytochrome P450